MSNDPEDPTNEETLSPEEAKELLISMSYEAITYLDRAIPEYKKISVGLEDSEADKREALEKLGNAEDGLKWLALYAHQCLAAGKEVLPPEIQESFAPFKENLLPAVRQIVGELEKVDTTALPKIINSHMLPLFSKLQDAARTALEHLTKDLENKENPKSDQQDGREQSKS